MCSYVFLNEVKYLYLVKIDRFFAPLRKILVNILVFQQPVRFFGRYTSSKDKYKIT